MTEPIWSEQALRTIELLAIALQLACKPQHTRRAVTNTGSTMSWGPMASTQQVLHD